MAANVWWITQINCEFENSEIFSNINDDKKRQLCVDLYEVKTSGNEMIPNQSSETININSHGFRGEEFSETKAKSKTQPIIGTQINIQNNGESGKIPLFAKNLEGYKNLIKLSSKSFLEIKDGEEPHCKIEDLEENKEGLILLSGSFDGLIGKLFFKNLTDDINFFFRLLLIII